MDGNVLSLVEIDREVPGVLEWQFGRVTEQQHHLASHLTVQEQCVERTFHTCLLYYAWLGSKFLARTLNWLSWNFVKYLFCTLVSNRLTANSSLWIINSTWHLVTFYLQVIVDQNLQTRFKRPLYNISNEKSHLKFRNLWKGFWNHYMI